MQYGDLDHLARFDVRFEVAAEARREVHTSVMTASRNAGLRRNEPGRLATPYAGLALAQPRVESSNAKAEVCGDENEMAVIVG